MFLFPVAVETLRPLSDEAHSLIAEIGMQKSHALHSRSAGNYVPVPTYFRGNSRVSMQCALPTGSQFVTIVDILGMN